MCVLSLQVTKNIKCPCFMLVDNNSIAISPLLLSFHFLPSPPLDLAPPHHLCHPAHTCYTQHNNVHIHVHVHCRCIQLSVHINHNIEIHEHIYMYMTKAVLYVYIVHSIHHVQCLLCHPCHLDSLSLLHPPLHPALEIVSKHTLYIHACM